MNWQIIFLLAGMIPLGIAMNNTGADKYISDSLLTILSGQSNLVIIGIIFLITMLISSVVSNNATAIIMTPIAIAVAVGLNLSINHYGFKIHSFKKRMKFFLKVIPKYNMVTQIAYRMRVFSVVGDSTKLKHL